MSYIGNPPAEAYTNTVKDSFSGDGSTVAFTLSRPSLTNDVRVVVENVIQDPTVAYSVSGTTLTFTSAPPSGTNNIYVVHLGPAVQTAVPPSEISAATTFASNVTVQGAFTSRGIDDNATSTAMTLNSSGVVTVGKTTTTSADDGVVLSPSIGSYFTRDGDYAGLFNRRTSDGEIVQFRKDNSLVGSVGTQGGVIRVGSGNTNVGFFTSGIVRIQPLDSTGTGNDASIDLGYSTSRFKDLYLSGGVYLGGTGAANKLDDFETGTWTPDLQIGGSTAGITYDARSGNYIKVGNLVFIVGLISLTNKGSNSGFVDIIGLPFTVADLTSGTSLDGAGGMCSFAGGTSSVYSSIGVNGIGGAQQANLYVANASGGDMNANLANGNITNSFSIRFSLTYYAA